MRERTVLPSQEDLLRTFAYCPETGILSRKSDGYTPKCRASHIHIEVNGKSALAHRIIWKMMTGEEPNLIDHKDCNGRNNRWLNLRPAEHKENLRNRGAPKHNTSGIKGVSFCNMTKRWRASIMVDYRCINLGRYRTIEEAAEVWRIAAVKLHGEFARTT